MKVTKNRLSLMLLVVSILMLNSCQIMMPVMVAGLVGYEFTKGDKGKSMPSMPMMGMMNMGSDDADTKQVKTAPESVSKANKKGEKK